MATATKKATKTDIDTLSINTIRTLSLDAVQRANSGHPGLPLGMAPAAYVLWTKFLRHNPKNPKWRQNIDVLLAEDRFAGIMDSAIATMRAHA
jgi:transketolase